MTERILTVEQVAELVSVSTKTVRRAIDAGHLRASRLSQERGCWRVFESAVEDWMTARANVTRPPRPLAPVDRVDPVVGPAVAGGRRAGRGAAANQTVDGRLVVPSERRTAA